jgi:hypothetical protein
MVTDREKFSALAGINVASAMVVNKDREWNKVNLDLLTDHIMEVLAEVCRTDNIFVTDKDIVELVDYAFAAVMQSSAAASKVAGK